jgi:hypothetical protein
MKLRRLGWSEDKVHMGEVRKSYRILVRKVLEK